MGKGSSRRPSTVPLDRFKSNWDNTFSRPETPDRAAKRQDQPEEGTSQNALLYSYRTLRAASASSPHSLGHPQRGVRSD